MLPSYFLSFHDHITVDRSDMKYKAMHTMTSFPVLLSAASRFADMIRGMSNSATSVLWYPSQGLVRNKTCSPPTQVKYTSLTFPEEAGGALFLPQIRQKRAGSLDAQVPHPSSSRISAPSSPPSLQMHLFSYLDTQWAAVGQSYPLLPTLFRPILSKAN